MQMKTFVALLRGINVSGQKIIRMNDLKDAFQTLKFKDATTYVQSGNVVFKTSESKSNSIAKKIEKLILSEFGFEVSVVVRTSEELNKIFNSNPFLKKKGIDLARLYVTFLSEVPGKNTLPKLEKYITQKEEYHLAGQELFLYCPNSYGKSKLNNNTVEKALSVVGTTRNWNTIGNLCQLMK